MYIRNWVTGKPEDKFEDTAPRVWEVNSGYAVLDEIYVDFRGVDRTMFELRATVEEAKALIQAIQDAIDAASRSRRMDPVVKFNPKNGE